MPGRAGSSQVTCVTVEGASLCTAQVLSEPSLAMNIEHPKYDYVNTVLFSRRNNSLKVNIFFIVFSLMFLD